VHNGVRRRFLGSMGICLRTLAIGKILTRFVVNDIIGNVNPLLVLVDAVFPSTCTPSSRSLICTTSPFCTMSQAGRSSISITITAIIFVIFMVSPLYFIIPLAFPHFIKKV
jgi:hypothetical protein